MWKNKLVTVVVVLCFFIYEARNFWNNPGMSMVFGLQNVEHRV